MATGFYQKNALQRKPGSTRTAIWTGPDILTVLYYPPLYDKRPIQGLSHSIR